MSIENSTGRFFWFVVSDDSVGEQLSSIAGKFPAEAARPNSDMLGEAPRLSRAELLDSISGAKDVGTESSPANTTNTREPRRSEDAERGREGQALESGEPGSAELDPFAVRTRTEEELAQQDENAARRTAEQEEVEAHQRANADEQADDLSLSGSDSPVDRAEGIWQRRIKHGCYANLA